MQSEPAPGFAAYGDVNNDGHIDIATPNTGSDSLSLLLNNGDGTFASQITIPSEDGPVGVAFGDLDSDGNLDLVRSINGTMKRVDSVRATAFSTSVDYDVTEVPGDSTLADLDNDGDLDIITVFLSGTSQVATLINDGAGNFSGPSSLMQVPDQSPSSHETSTTISPSIS